jgi:hypothetical protein
MRGRPQHLHGGWYLVSGSIWLSVSELAGRHWTYSDHGCIARPVLDPQAGTTCAVAKSAPPMPPAPGVNRLNPPPTASWPIGVAAPQPVPDEIAGGGARPVLQAVGVTADSAQIETAGSQRSVVFNPRWQA